MKRMHVPPNNPESQPRHWEHLADELHRLGYSYGYTQGVFADGKLAWIVDAYKHGGHDYRATAATREEAFEEVVRLVTVL